jgi:hypothetical protein
MSAYKIARPVAEVDLERLLAASGTARLRTGMVERQASPSSTSARNIADRDGTPLESGTLLSASIRCNCSDVVQ